MKKRTERIMKSIDEKLLKEIRFYGIVGLIVVIVAYWLIFV